MRNFQEALSKNPLRTKTDLEEALVDLVTPVYECMARQGTPGRVHLGNSGAVYTQEKSDVEGFLRTLWGLGPLFSQEEACLRYPKLFQQANAGIVAGTTPTSQEYWGKLHDYDQLFVEMGALASYLIFTKPVFWDLLTPREQTNLFDWLNQINQHTIPKTNWLFFRILVNTFFEMAALPFVETTLLADQEEIERYYLADGWYFDGYENQIDYYIPFGMQYYGLLYSVLTCRSQCPYQFSYRQRAATFAQSFKQWFTKTGAALPFGRSLTYRFAQSSFFAVGAFADIEYEGFTKNEGKYLLLQNMRYWFRQPIFTQEGFLSIGYAYPNLNMAEGYNAPGSPYWAFKNFCVLAIPADAEFWTLEEQAPTFATTVRNPHSRMLLVHNQEGTELQAFTAGQHSHEHAHGNAKYEKFVYSTTFGFSVSKATVLLKQGAYDNTLAISEGQTDFKTAFGYEAFAIEDDYVYSRWRPYEQVVIETFVIPMYPWHLRYHRIQTDRRLQLVNGSFAAPADGAALSSKEGTFYQSSVGCVGIKSFPTHQEGTLLMPEPNTNLLYSRTVIPQVSKTVLAGQQEWLVACLGNAFSDQIPPFDVTITADKVAMSQGDQRKTIQLSY